MMMGGGFLFMLAVLGLPVMAIAGLVLWIASHGSPGRPLSPPAVERPMLVKTDAACDHCGATMQADWLHCPRCGAPARMTTTPHSAPDQV